MKTAEETELRIVPANPRGLKLVVRYQEQGFPVSLSDFTCARCLREPDCEFSWDLYNTDGDCLDSK